eukprot:GHVL01015668.1.p1 GENE.GHVL01015668.1~~GHVL01015668.1.p1  ORF type:complete len:137 (+),score=21.21 GHVL01015668.1:3-413(+)
MNKYILFIFIFFLQKNEGALQLALSPLHLMLQKMRASYQGELIEKRQTGYAMDEDPLAEERRSSNLYFLEYELLWKKGYSEIDGLPVGNQFSVLDDSRCSDEMGPYCPNLNNKDIPIEMSGLMYQDPTWNVWLGRT